MNIAVIIFPGSNCDRDISTAIKIITGKEPYPIWHQDSDLGKPDLVFIPGGFSFGDYLRCGSIAAQSPAMNEVINYVLSGGKVIGICNGFQVLIEMGLLPGALINNNHLKFTCRDVMIKAHHTQSTIMQGVEEDASFRIPVAHNEGQFFADPPTMKRIEDKGQIAFSYIQDDRDDYNPNGSMNDIAGITSENGRVLGMMPHPERRISQALGGSDGRDLLLSLIEGQG